LCFCAKNKTTIGNCAEVVTQKNAAMVEETNAAGANPASEASQLHDLISQFNLGADSHDDKHVATATE
jgi:methyl-accepting chemotaxis protein